MKKLIFLTLLLVIPQLWGQNARREKSRHFSKRFEELEKVKLLEALDLKEDQAIKFFARRNQVKQKIEELRKDAKRTFNEMEELLNEKGSDNQYSEMIKKVQSIDQSIINEKSKFINNLSDILSEEQIVKMVLFERKFRKDVRDLLIEKGRKKFKKEKFNYKN